MYCNAIAAGGAEEWEFAWSEFQNTTIASEAEKLRSALACTTQTWLLNRSAHRQSQYRYTTTTTTTKINCHLLTRVHSTH